MAEHADTADTEEMNTSTFDELLANNVRFAATDAKDRVPAIPFLPNKQVYVITCIDLASTRRPCLVSTSATRSSPQRRRPRQ